MPRRYRGRPITDYFERSHCLILPILDFFKELGAKNIIDEVEIGLPFINGLYRRLATPLLVAESDINGVADFQKAFFGIGAQPFLNQHSNQHLRSMSVVRGKAAIILMIADVR